MIRKILLNLLIIVVCTIFIGCDLQESIMEAPKLPDDQEEIRELLKSLIKPEAKLTTLNTGKDRSAIQFSDLDGDGNDEVVISYILEKDPEPLRCLVLKKDDNTWRTLGEVKGIGHSIDRVDFKDVTGDGRKEIIIGWQLGDFDTKGISVYQLHHDQLKEILVDSYTEAVIGDIDSDGVSDIVLIKLKRDELRAKALLFKNTGEKLELADEVEMDGTIMGYSNIVFGKARDGQNGIFLDSGVGAHSAQTELLVMDEGKLKNPFFDPKKGIDEKVFKPYNAFNRDIDGDGIIEIANLRAPAGYEYAAMANVPWIETWYKWDGEDRLIPCNESYANYAHGYRFMFPSKWDKNITIDLSKGDMRYAEVIFSYLNKYNDKKHFLFAIKTFNLAEWSQLEDSKDDESKYVKIAKDSNRVYAVRIAKGNGTVARMKLTIDEIRQNLKIIDE